MVAEIRPLALPVFFQMDEIIVAVKSCTGHTAGFSALK